MLYTEFMFLCIILYIERSTHDKCKVLYLFFKIWNGLKRIFLHMEFMDTTSVLYIHVYSTIYIKF